MSLRGSGVAFALPVEDVDRAKKFYVESLGLDFTGTNPEGSAMFSLGGGAQLMLLHRPGGQRSESTAMTWAVEDIGREVKDLEAAGVQFEDYDGPEPEDRRPHRRVRGPEGCLVPRPRRQRALRPPGVRRLRREDRLGDPAPPPAAGVKAAWRPAQPRG